MSDPTGSSSVFRIAYAENALFAYRSDQLHKKLIFKFLQNK